MTGEKPNIKDIIVLVGQSGLDWHDARSIPSRTFTCWQCGCAQASDKGWTTRQQNASICVCHRCGYPTLIYSNSQVPGVPFGSPVGNINDESVEKLYEEARRAMSASCYTCVVLACRKLLMHIAVSKGANEGERFLFYVSYLAVNHYVPPDSRGWVDHIRQRGNEANHEITIMGQDDAEDLLRFCEMLLKLVFEFPAKARQASGASQTTT